MAGFLTHRNFKLSDTPDLAGKVAVVTGGQAGIGREIVAQLLLHGITKVYILARTASKFEESKAEWTTKHGISKEDVDTKTAFAECDLNSVNDVWRVATELLVTLERLDILVNNAAIALTTAYALSPDGVENVFATNHLGHFTLTNTLMPVIERTARAYGEARIVVTSSSLHMLCQELKLSDLESSTPSKSPASFDSVWRYGRSKLANLLFTHQLAKILRKKGVENVYVNAYFPGNIPTDAWKTWGNVFGSALGAVTQRIFKLVGQSLTDGAATAIFLAAGKDVVSKDLRGKYFVPIATEHKTSELAENKDLANNLWYWSDHKVTSILGTGWAEGGSKTETVAVPELAHTT